MGIFDKMVDTVSKKVLIDTAVNATLKTVAATVKTANAVADYSNKKEYVDPKIIKVPHSSDHYLSMNYQDVQDELTAYGFTNIVLLPKKDLIKGWLTQNGSIEAISINGKTEFKEKHKFPVGVRIVITYHTFRDSR